MKIARLFIAFAFIGCSQEQKEIPAQAETPKETVVEETSCYDPNNDVTDSLLMVFDEILDKGNDYNQSKFEIQINKWAGKSIEMQGVPVHLIMKSDEYLSPSVTLEYGAYESFPWAMHVCIDMEFSTDEEITRFEMGDGVDFRGQIQYGKITKTTYKVQLLCQEILN